jgi:hypothetical protein
VYWRLAAHFSSFLIWRESIALLILLPWRFMPPTPRHAEVDATTNIARGAVYKYKPKKIGREVYGGLDHGNVREQPLVRNDAAGKNW